MYNEKRLTDQLRHLRYATWKFESEQLELNFTPDLNKLVGSGRLGRHLFPSLLWMLYGLSSTLVFQDY